MRSRKYLEADSLLTLLTRNKGKVGAIAKGVRKINSALRGGVQVFTFNDMLLAEGKNLDVVTQSQCLEAFTPLQSQMEAMTAACYWSELIEAMTPEGQGDEALFHLALAGYHLLCLNPVELTVRALEIRLLTLQGYRPCLEKCVSCGNVNMQSGPVTFSVPLGGLLCSKCLEKPDQVGSLSRPLNRELAFSLEALRAWQQLDKMELSKIGRLKVSDRGLAMLDQVIEEFLLRQLDYPLKSRAIMKSMLRVNGDRKV